jgi:hypothetical protein
MSITTKANEWLQKYPVIKKTVKRLYQIFFYIISPKTKSQGNIELIAESGDDAFFGYYDKCPWDATQRYFLFISAKDMNKNVCAKGESDIIIFDTQTGDKKVVASTNTCNSQQGCMLQWLGPEFDRTIIYNDFIDGQYRSVILDILTLEKRIIDFPVYTVASDGKTAYSLDFARLHRLRPGYGYDKIVDKTRSEQCPDAPCLYRLDLDNNSVQPLLTYSQLKGFQTRQEMENAEHKINHIMISPNMKRIMFLHRWINKGKRYSRLVTCDAQGHDLFNLLDDDMVSHCNWLDDTNIISYARKKGIGNRYYKLTDQTLQVSVMFEELKQDGHPSLSPNGDFIVTDTYPNKKRVQTIYLCHKNPERVTTIGHVFASFKYDNDTRCDLHPRFNRDGSQICFDGTFEGKRKVYIIDLKRSSNG